jgi:hypothetical protein
MEENKSRFYASPNEWQALVKELASSGMSAAEFCRKRDVPVWQMYYRLGQKQVNEPTQHGFVEIGKPDPKPCGLWVEAGQFRIRVERGFDTELLRHVAEALT